MLQRATRLPTRVLIHVHTDSGGFDATLGNLSATGARLLGVPDQALRVGDQVDILCQGQSHRAEVRWHFDDTCGLMFSGPLDEGQITTILASRMIN